MICAEIPILSRSHEDAFPKISTNGDTTWYVNAISDGLVSLGGEVSPTDKNFGHGSLWHTTIAMFLMLI